MTTISKEFRQIENKFKKKLPIPKGNICSEDLSVVFHVHNIKGEPENIEFLAKINQILSQCGIDAWKARKEAEQQPKKPGLNVCVV